MKTLLKIFAFSSALALLAFNLPIYLAQAAAEKAHADHEEGEAGHETHDDHVEKAGGHDEHGHDEHGHGEHEEAAAELAKGPNKGRLLVNGDITLELAIFEDGIPPEYRAWVTRAGKAIAPDPAQLEVALTRLGDGRRAIPFKVEGNYLRSTVEVTEPHSFAVEVKLSLDGVSNSWKFDSFEGRTQISAAAALAAGVSTAIVGPSDIGETRRLFGQVTLDPDRSAKVRARFAGLVREVYVNTGDLVSKGQVLASVESNDSLRSYSVAAPIAGTVMARMTNVGDVAGFEPLFEISDTTNVLVEIRAFGRDAQLLVPGVEVLVSDRISDTRFGAKIARVLPKLEPVTRATIALARLAAPSASLRPGTAVSVDVGMAKKAAALSVDVRALQRFRDWDVVFIQVGDQYEIRPLEIGQRDSRFAEVLNGIKAGDRYVVEQSFLVKADIEKSGAAHDH
jgi:cobalt-zinc-cadmium efflux system membrane fusion protein